MNPLISAIVPVYNAERYLADCLESLIRQTHRELEILVIDDGSRMEAPPSVSASPGRMAASACYGRKTAACPPPAIWGWMRHRESMWPLWMRTTGFCLKCWRRS